MDADGNEPELPAEARAAIAAGRKVDAIRILRESEGIGLQEASARVGRHISRDPALKLQLERQQAELKRTVIRWVIIADVIIVAALLWWFFGR